MWVTQEKFEAVRFVKQIFTLVSKILQVCPLNGDILAVVFLRINADPPPNKSTAQEQG